MDLNSTYLSYASFALSLYRACMYLHGGVASCAIVTQRPQLSRFVRESHSFSNPVTLIRILENFSRKLTLHCILTRRSTRLWIKLLYMWTVVARVWLSLQRVLSWQALPPCRSSPLVSSWGASPVVPEASARLGETSRRPTAPTTGPALVPARTSGILRPG